MSELLQLPNIGQTLDKQLQQIGITTKEELRKIGSKKAWLKIKQIDSSACYNRLCALEGAIRGIRWHDLDQESKSQLKEFYSSHL